MPVSPSGSDSRAKYAWICGDVIGVGNFWREVPEIPEAGSKPTHLGSASLSTTSWVAPDAGERGVGDACAAPFVT